MTGMGAYLAAPCRACGYIAAIRSIRVGGLALLWLAHVAFAPKPFKRLELTRGIQPEAGYYNQQLQVLDAWSVLRLIANPPDAGNKVPYDRRGWCFFESIIESCQPFH